MSDFISYIENFNTSCFDHDKIEVFIASHQNIISDYSDYRFNKHIEFIKRRSFIKILLKDYEFKFREIQ